MNIQMNEPHGIGIRDTHLVHSQNVPIGIRIGSKKYYPSVKISQKKPYQSQKMWPLNSTLQWTRCKDGLQQLAC